MNDVHSTVARKLRSAAAALRADIEATHFVNLRNALLAEVVVIEKRAAAIEEQAKPAIEEPKEFGSVVRVRREAATTHYFRSYSIPVDEPWCTGNSHWSWPDVIAEATDVEVLRVGIGGESGDAYSRGYEEGVQSNLPSPVDRSNILSAIRDELEQTAGGLTAAVMRALS